MNTRFLEWLVFAVFGGVMLYSLHHILAGSFPANTTPAHGAGDWATWVGAIGTVGTLIGTIWLATAATRREKQIAHDSAVLAAAGIQIRLLDTLHALVAIAEELGRPIEDDGKPQPYVTWAHRIRSSITWQIADLTPLIHAKGQPAPALAVAREWLLSCADELQSRPFNQDYDDFEYWEAAEFNQSQADIVHGAAEMIREAKRACDRLLEHVPAP
ncbi:hypothetical protein GJ699_02470 [Duganella sp. FT80W]|uniref:Uncharacterized protein n=1 Tax=Duganella guangzhouensis TaxID=2666084 RepID=A0A6I2KSY2_9BURK|nr:hypothetical protein [Duganella guangzhouensis]MRW88843.1 hypothetical protein [Duganella guangzhouensis]